MVSTPQTLAERAERMIRENEEAVRQSRERAAARERAVRESQIIVERAISRLKRAGLLR